MSNISQAGARDRGHQIGCPAMRLAEADCACPRAEGVDTPERVPWYAWVMVVLALACSIGLIVWVTLGQPTP